LVTVLSLHLAAAFREKRLDEIRATTAADGFVEVCAADQIPENRAVVISLAGERVAVFRYDGNISAISNVCRHQNGPLGEGRIVDGCVTCPWHGYQYLPDTGASPPPFTEKVPTYRARIVDGKVLVHPCAHAPGTRIEPARIDQAMRTRT
jgi:nitrite reductase/ring-hydroxylating ferredoxin subunit